MLLSAKPPKCPQCKRRVDDPRKRLHDECADAWIARQLAKQAEARKKRERAQTRARREALERIPDLIRAAQREFNAYIRARDEGRPCICCGRHPEGSALTGGEWDCGHYRSTGSASHLRFNEDNAHRQLKVCNRHGAGRAVDYRIGLIERIGLARVEALETDNAVRKWTREELREIRDTYRAKLKELRRTGA